MKKKTKLIAVFAALILILSCFAACGSGAPEEPAEEPAAAEAQIPAEVQTVKDKVSGIADKYAKKLDGDWGDQHAALLESEEGENYKDFKDMKAVLDGYREESGAYYVYALYPKDTAKTDSEPFTITVDGSEDPDPYGEAYDWEIQFQEAWEGAPAAARSAWADDDEGKDLCWSAFAPIHDSEGNIVAILGVDYPSPEILDYPEWNRDSDSWNGITE